MTIYILLRPVASFASMTRAVSPSILAGVSTLTIAISRMLPLPAPQVN